MSHLLEQPNEQPETSERAQQPPAVEDIVDAQKLFLGRREIWIEHAGVRYRLRITRRNRLILQK